jgi:hypothetical protein
MTEDTNDISSDEVTESTTTQETENLLLGPKKELAKIISRYGIESVLQSFIDLTEPSGNPERHIADLHARLVMSLKTYQKSYDKD